MAFTIETRTGRCPDHGSVTGEREMPGLSWPFILYAIRRAQARRRPFLCPTCRKPIETG